MIIAILVSFAAGCVLGVWISTALTATLARQGAACPAAPLEKKRGAASWPRSKRRGPLVQSRRSMLSTVQQEAVSALMNLGATFRDAEGAVLAATGQGAGAGFDEVFRVAVMLLHARNGKAAA